MQDAIFLNKAALIAQEENSATKPLKSPCAVSTSNIKDTAMTINILKDVLTLLIMEALTARISCMTAEKEEGERHMDQEANALLETSFRRDFVNRPTPPCAININATMVSSPSCQVQGARSFAPPLELTLEPQIPTLEV